MKVTKIFHTCFMVEHEGHRGLIDPALVFPIYATYVPREGIRLDLDVLLGQHWDFVFISHSHRDHFDPYTLVRLPRETLILHGSPAVNLPPFFDQLGFTNRRSIEPWEVHRVGPFELMPIPTHTAGLETGLAIRDGGACFAHLIDVHTNDEINRGYVERWGPPQLFSPITLPSNEHHLSNAETCRTKTHDELRAMAREYRVYGAGHVILSGHDLAVAVVPWVNHRLFPNTPEEHVAAYRAEAVAPEVEFARAGQWWRIAPGGVVESGTQTLGVNSGGPVYDGRFDSTVPVRPFGDRREFPAVADLARQAQDFETALLRIVSTVPAPERAILREIGLWRYQIHHPEGISFDAVLDMRGEFPFWGEPRATEMNLTTLTSSGLAALTQQLIGHHSMRICDQIRTTAPSSESRHDPSRRYPTSLSYDLTSIHRAVAGKGPWSAQHLPAGINFARAAFQYP